MKPFIYLMLLSVLVFSSCKKHEQPELTEVNEDCDCASEVSADFEILELEELPQFDPVGTDTDTIFLDANVLFRAKENGAEYTWYIGSEVLNTQEVGRSFPLAYADQSITVSLVVRKTANTICFPMDDGYDSISRTFYVQNYNASDYTSTYDNGQTLMEGVYRMKGPHLPDSFGVTIDYIDRTPPPSPEKQIDILNFDGLGSNVWIPRNISTGKTYRSFWADMTGTNFNCMTGSFIYNMNGEAVFDFDYCEEVNGEYVDKSLLLRGRKL